MDLEPVIEDDGCPRILIFDKIINHFVAFLNIIFIQLILTLLALQQSYLSFQLGILFFQSGNNDAWVYSFISRKVVFNEGYAHGKLASSYRL